MSGEKRSFRGWAHSAQAAGFKSDGTFYVDMFDFNPDGPGDYVWILYVLKDDVPGLRAKLAALCGTPIGSDIEMLEATVAQFTNSRSAADWIEAEGVPYITRTDPFGDMTPEQGP